MYYSIGNRVFNTSECCLTLPKTKKIRGEGVTFLNSGHRLALGHVNDMRCLGKVHAPANVTEENPNLKYHKYIYHDL